MSAASELSPKVATMRTEFRNMFGDYLRGKGLMFDGDTVVGDPSNMIVYEPPPVPGEEQARYQAFLADLNMLCGRIERFYPLDPLDLTILGGTLGQTPRRGSVVENFDPTNVSGCIGYADSHWMSKVDGMINEGQWTGAAAEAFHQQFLFPFHTASQQQRDYLRELHVAVQIYHDAIERGIEDMHKILDACIARLRGEGGGGGIGFFSFLSIASGVVGLFVSGGAGVALGVAGLVSGIAAEATASPGGQPPEFVITGGNFQEILESAWAAVLVLEDQLCEVDSQLQRGLERDLSSPVGFASPGLRLDRPSLAAERDPSFGELTVTAAPGVPIGQNPVVASIVDLYQAGQVNLPAAAGEYGAACALLFECKLPGYLVPFFQRSTSYFEEARVRLGGIFGVTEMSLNDCGAALVQIASGYQLTDEQSAEVVHQSGRLAPPPPRDSGQVVPVPSGSPYPLPL